MQSSGTRNASPGPTSSTWGPACWLKDIPGTRSTMNFPSWGQGSARPGMQHRRNLENTSFCNLCYEKIYYIYCSIFWNCHFLLLTPSSQTNLSRKRWKLTVWPLGAEFANRRALGLLKMQKGKTVWWNFLPIIRRQWALRIHPPLCCPTPFSPPPSLDQSSASKLPAERGFLQWDACNEQLCSDVAFLNRTWNLTSFPFKDFFKMTVFCQLKFFRFSTSFGSLETADAT